MCLHRIPTALFVLLSAVALTFGLVAPAWAASSQHAAAVSAVSMRARSATSLTNKVTLPDTSIDGPSLSSIGSETVLAWTAADAAHHLSVETTTDGLHYGHKLVLNETSPFRPDVALANEGGAVSVAWTGSDANHSLNVLYDVYGAHPFKLTLRNENSFTAPALLVGPGTYLAWTGTDANHSLNVLQLFFTNGGLVAGQKTILSQDSSDAGPRLARSSATVMDLEWSARGTHQLRIATATHPDALEPGSPIAELSAAAPDTFALGPFIGAGNQEWIGWTGTDQAHHLNLQSTTTFPRFPSPAATKTVLADTAIGGAAVSFTTANHKNLLAWTGTDAAHHLNVANFA